jgi:hypothetical protein
VLVRVWTKILAAEVTLIEGLRKEPRSLVPPMTEQNKKTNVIEHRSPERVLESWAVLQGRNYVLLRPPNLCGERQRSAKPARNRCGRSRAMAKTQKQSVISRIVIHHAVCNAAPVVVR